MSSTDKYEPYSMNFAVAANIISKVEHFNMYPSDDKNELKLIVYGDNEPVSSRMWKSIFRHYLDDECYEYSTDFPLIPIPAHNTPERYEQYEKELRKYVAAWAASGNFIWGLYNVAAPGHDPRMHLVFANRHVKRSELGVWARSDRRRLVRPSIFIGKPSILRWELSGEDSGTVRWSALNSASLIRDKRSVRSSFRGSPAELFRDLSRTDSDEEVEGEHSSACNSASPSFENYGAHQDPRFISIESLRCLISNLLDFYPLSSRPY